MGQNKMKKEFNITEWILEQAKEKEETQLQFPDGFQPAKSVPQGGAMCANCAKWDKKKQLCEGQYYIDWHANGKIPAEPTEFTESYNLPERVKFVEVAFVVVKDEAVIPLVAVSIPPTVVLPVVDKVPVILILT